MSEEERREVECEFRDSIKAACANMAEELLDPGYIPSKVVEHHTEHIKRLFDIRQKALDKLKPVKIERVHLEVVAQYIRDTAVELGCKLGKYRFFNNISCFAKPTVPMCLADDDICRACLAISSLLKEEKSE